ncbi:MAG: hypothetical protein CMK89_17545 [Pseudomonadales bacterium]|nr:hypothetical protein [Pseudomonadales bacterium]
MLGYVFWVAMAFGMAGTAWATETEGEGHPRDPWEGFNRAMFGFNDTLDFYVLKPVAKGYDKAMPDPLQDGVSNFFNNIGEIRTIFNGLLQFKFKQAGLDTTRFLVNTTVGVFGFIDIGSRIGLEQHDEDFGQTLGYWGVGSGPYVVLPLLGPNTVRDSIGLIPDDYISPYQAVDHDLTRYSIRALQVVDLRAGLLEAESLIAGDRYSFFRDAYLQRRDFLVNDGQMADDFLEDDDLFEDFDDEESWDEGAPEDSEEPL